MNSRLMFGMVPGLESTRKLCEALGNPQNKFKTIHVVGTNGKGSTSFYLAGILQAHGFKTGLFTSPHLVSLQERIRVNDAPIPADDLDRLLLQVKSAADSLNANASAPMEPTFFEVLTLVAFLYYAEQQIDVVVLEAGMGGRLDSTAVAQGNMAIVTSIGLEHTEVLGATESAILKEKMAVLGEGDLSQKTFIVGGLSQDLLEEAKQFAESAGARLVVPEIRNEIQLPNLGHHYVENASLSLAAAKMFCDLQAVSAGNSPQRSSAVPRAVSAEPRSASGHSACGPMAFNDVLALNCLRARSWAGRMQTLSDASGKVRYILDGAHNSHAVRRLVEALGQYYPGQKFHCVFGALKDKDVGEMLRLMAPYVSHWHITKTPYPRFRELDDLRSQLSSLGLTVSSEGLLSRKFLDDVSKAAEGGACDSNKKDCPVLITGSLYMIGESVQALKNDFEGLSFFRGLEPSTNEHR